MRDAISGIRDDLPLEMEEPILRRFDPADMPIVSLVLDLQTLDAGRADAARRSRGSPASCGRSPASAQVTVAGDVEREITVELRPADLQAARRQHRAGGAGGPGAEPGGAGGRIEGPARPSRRSACSGRLETPEEFAQLVVTRARRPARSASARWRTCSDGTAEQRTLALYNGGDAVGIDITKSKGYSTTTVADAGHGAARDASARPCPQGVEMEVVRDAGERVRDSVRNVEEALIEGAMLTVLVVFLFLNSWRSTVITGLALPGLGARRRSSPSGRSASRSTPCRCSACRSRSAS